MDRKSKTITEVSLKAVKGEITVLVRGVCFSDGQELVSVAWKGLKKGMKLLSSGHFLKNTNGNA